MLVPDTIRAMQRMDAREGSPGLLHRRVQCSTLTFMRNAPDEARWHGCLILLG
jgi:hypothetical protein